MKTIESPRLLMRPFTPDDVDAVYAFSAHPQVSRYTGDAGKVQSRADAARIIEAIWLPEYERIGYGRYALVHKTDNAVIGFCGFKYEPELGGADMGYRMLPRYWGQGLATEAVQACLPFGRDVLGLNRVYGQVMVGNIASMRVLEKCGFDFLEEHPEEDFRVRTYVKTLR